MATIKNKDQLKLVLRENDMQYFDDTELDAYIELNDGNLDDTAYQCLLIKAEKLETNVSGLKTNDMSGYFRMLASQYRPSNSGNLEV